MLFTQTAPGLRAMTPDYASPEQIKGEKITTASDVYSLGVLLYELLTGQKAVSAEDSHAGGNIARDYRAGAGASEHRSRDATSNRNSQLDIRKSLRGDLDNIVLMALRKEPARRYSSVAQFSEDIRRHLEGRPVIAHKDTFDYRATKFIRRNTIAVAAAAFLLLTLIGGIVATAWQAKRATQQARIADEQARVASAARDRAQREGAKAQSINTFLQNILGLSDPTWVAANARGNAHERTIADAIDEAVRRADTELADQPEVLAAVQFSIGRIYGTRGRVDRAEALLRSSLRYPPASSRLGTSRDRAKHGGSGRAAHGRGKVRGIGSPPARSGGVLSARAGQKLLPILNGSRFPEWSRAGTNRQRRSGGRRTVSPRIVEGG